MRLGYLCIFGRSVWRRVKKASASLSSVSTAVIRVIAWNLGSLPRYYRLPSESTSTRRLAGKLWERWRIDAPAVGSKQC